MMEIKKKYDFFRREIGGKIYKKSTPVKRNAYGSGSPHGGEKLTLVSYYGGAAYYEEKAGELREKCDSLGVAHDIVRIETQEGESWSSICRRKISFYREMLEKHKSSIMWVDVDTDLLKNINGLAVGDFDIALFMRNFKYLPQFNSSSLSRSFHPGYLLFKYTSTTIHFLDDAVKIERGTEGEFTDDFVLEEAFRTSSAMPRLLLLSPQDIAKPGDEKKPEALFRHGDSGNVKEFKRKVLQHQPRALESETQKTVLRELISKAARQGKKEQVIFLLRHLVAINPKDVESYAKLLNLLKKYGEEAQLKAELKRGSESDYLASQVLRFKLLRALEERKWKRADEIFQEVLSSGDEKLIAFFKSRCFRYDLDRRAEAAGVPDEDRVKLFWWEEPYPGNLGDIINPYIVEKLTGKPPMYAPAGDGMCAIGSVIKFAREGTPVWGSGSPHSSDALHPQAHYHSVRGPHTRNLVLQNGGTCPEVYGDAAWILPLIYAPTVSKKFRTGLILHFTHEESDLDVDPGIKLIPIKRVGYSEIEEFIDEMLSCERIVSTSLHGVIIANAYGIPACLATVSQADRQIHGDGVKFADYYASVGVNNPPVPVDLSNLSKVNHESFNPDDFTPVGEVDVGAILEAAPFEILPEFRGKVKKT